VKENNNINKLPNNWVQTRLGKIVQPSKEKTNPLKVENLPYIGLEHINKDTGQLLGYGNSKDVKSTKSKFCNGDLLYGKLRPYLNKVHVVSFEGICSTDILVFHKQPYLSNKFLGLRFLSKDFVEYANQNVNGVQHPRVSFDALSQFNIALPPLNEQKRIVTKIEALQTKSTAAKQQLQQIKPLLDRFRQSVLAAAFRGDLTKTWREQNPDVEPAEVLLERIKIERRRRWEEAELEKMKAQGKVPKDDNWKKKYKEPEAIDTEGLSELPDGWCWVNYELITQESQNGLSKRRGTQGQLIPVLRLVDIKNNKIAPEETREILLTDNELERYLLYTNDLLCIRVNGSEDLVGRIIIFDQDNKWAFCDHFIRYKLVDKLLSVSYVANFFNTQVVRQYIKQYRVSSAGQNTVSQTTLGNIPTPIAPLQEQKEIVRRIESLFKLADAIAQQYQQAETQLETLNQSILAKAFRGELVPQDPNDEPASVLLERIKAEKTKQETTGKKTKKKDFEEPKIQQLNLDL
jgi:type I restriction enzyme, S subunit